MISREEILMGRDKNYPLSKEQEDNLAVLLERINIIRSKYGKPMIVSSGYRPSQINASVGGAKNSTHSLCMAVDIRDTDGNFRKWVLQNLLLFQELGLWVEDFRWTSTWVHIQTRPARKRIFIPYADQNKNPMTNPSTWDGKYDPELDK